MHAKADNPELLKAQELGLKIYSYPEFLYEQSKHKTRVVIGGSHGKTTITSMILHVMHYHDRDVDYMVGAQLEGFDVMVKLTEDNDFIVLEGDEYLSSPIDRRPKFHLYKPNIALLSGIAWDHINVFPTYENYVEQFSIFVDSIVSGGSINYNEEDPEVKRVVEASNNTIRKIAYQTPEYTVENGETLLETPEGHCQLKFLVNTTLIIWLEQNGFANTWVLMKMIFTKPLLLLKERVNVLEKIAESKNSVAYKDFAHSPSKVEATTNAVKEQYVNRTLVACLELHTYSSLNAEFLKEYKGALDAADVAVVFYSPHAVEIKKLAAVTHEQIANAFERDDLIIYTNPDDFKDFLFTQNLRIKLCC